MALGEPGTGEYILITDYSKEADGPILHQVRHGWPGLLRQKEENAVPEKNYHNSKGELLALGYGLCIGRPPWMKMKR